MKINFIDLQTQYRNLKPEIDAAIHAVLDSSQYIMGTQSAAFEKAAAAWLGVKHAIVCGSGTQAILLALMALDIGPGDEVIVPPFTFFATAEMPALLKIKPVFVDIDPDTYMMNPDLIADKISTRTKAIIPVHLYGQCADMERITAIAQKNNIAVIEDAAQAFGSERNGTKAGAFGALNAFSFFPSKPLGCYGEGGMVTTNDDALAEKCRLIRVHGMSKRYYHDMVGINGRLDEIQAAVLSVKLRYYNETMKLREEKGAYYTEHLKEYVTTPVIDAGNNHIYAQYTIAAEDRDALAAHCTKNDIPTAVHYPGGLYNQPALAFLHEKTTDYPICAQAARTVISLPFYPDISQEHQDMVITTIQSFFA